MSNVPPEKKFRRSKPKSDHNTISIDSSLLEHVPPHNLDAERGVIGALLLDPLVVDDVVPLLSADDFYSDANRRIYKHLVEMKNSGGAIDLTLLIDRLEKSEELEAIGGQAYIAELMFSPQVAAHAVYYAGIVREKGTLRRLIHAGSSIVQEAFAPDTTTKDLLNKAAEQMFELCESQTVNQISDMYTVMMEATAYIDSRMRNEQDGISTGYADLDKILDGFHPNELIILAARPGIGKTALAMNIAEKVAVDQKKAVLMVSLEMARRELALRLICSRGKISGERIRKNLLSSQELERFYSVVAEMSQAPMFFDDTPSRTVSEIAAVARRLSRQHDLQLLVIDYLGLITADNASDPRQEQVAKMARRLKGLARELHVPILCLAQLNRQVEAGKDMMPKLSHLRESGAIEQDADVVMFVHRDTDPGKGEDEQSQEALETAKIIIAKQRAGSTGVVEMVWQRQYTRFVSKATQSQEEFEGYASDFSGGDFNNYGSDPAVESSPDFD